MTEAAIDTAEELVKHERGHPPASNPDVLSHTYGNIIDHDVVYNALQDLERYRSFVQAVRDHLESIGALDD